MPIRRARGPKPILRHLAFLSTMAESVEGTATHLEARAGFLALRELDHWIAYGVGGGAPTERSTEAAAEAIRAVTEDSELRTAYEAIVLAITMISDVDAQPVLPRVFALGALLEQRGRTAQAADVFTTVARYADPVAHVDLAYDASMRRAACLRQEGELDHADQAYTHAGTLAARTRDRVRVLTARVGRAKVISARGNLPDASVALEELESEAREGTSSDLVAIILHERAAVAHAQGDFPAALQLAWKAFRLSSDEYDRERMLWDISNYLGLLGAEETARDALQLIALGTKHQAARLLAFQNLMDLARRTGNEIEFHQYRKLVPEQLLPAPRRVSYLFDVGTGFARFGDVAAARETLRRGLTLAESARLNQRVFQIEALLLSIEQDAASEAQRQSVRTSAIRTETPLEIREGLRELVREVERGAGAQA